MGAAAILGWMSALLQRLGVELPIVRMIVFIPVATPVWLWSTASTIRFAIAANEKPIPSPISAVAM